MPVALIAVALACILSACSAGSLLTGRKGTIHPEQQCDQQRGGCWLVDTSTPNDRTAVCRQTLSAWIYRVNKYQLSQGAFSDYGRIQIYPRTASIGPIDRCYGRKPAYLHREGEFLLGLLEFNIDAYEVYGYHQNIPGAIYVISEGDVCIPSAEVNVYLVGSRLPEPYQNFVRQGMGENTLVPGSVLGLAELSTLVTSIRNEKLADTVVSPRLFFAVGDLVDLQCGKRSAALPISIRYIKELPLQDNIRSNGVMQNYLYKGQTYDYLEHYTGVLDGNSLQIVGKEVNAQLKRQEYEAYLLRKQQAGREAYRACREAQAAQATIGMGSLLLRGWPGLVYDLVVDVPSAPDVC